MGRSNSNCQKGNDAEQCIRIKHRLVSDNLLGKHCEQPVFFGNVLLQSSLFGIEAIHRYNHNPSNSSIQQKTFPQEMLDALQQKGFTIQQLAKLIHIHPPSLRAVMSNNEHKLKYFHFKRLLSLYSAECLMKTD